jgi:hypothetical protein
LRLGLKLSRTAGGRATNSPFSLGSEFTNISRSHCRMLRKLRPWWISAAGRFFAEFVLKEVEG